MQRNVPVAMGATALGAKAVLLEGLSTTVRFF
jgi:hypothetical protein